MDNVKFKRIVVKRGSTPSLAIPHELMEFLEIEFGEDLEIIGDKGKHGKFIAIYKKQKR